MTDKNNANIYTSRFVVDLRKNIEVEKEVAEEKKEKVGEKLVDLYKRFSKWNKIPLALRLGEPPARRAFMQRGLTHLKKLAIFNLIGLGVILFKIFGRSFYKFCYRLGWLTVYGGRLIYLSGATSTRVAVSVTKKIWPLLYYFPSLLRRGIRGGFVARALNTKPHLRPLLGKEREFGLRMPRFNSKSVPAVFSFAVILFIIILPFKAFTYYKSLSFSDLRGRVAEASKEAIGGLFSGARSVSDLDFKDASQDFSKAAENFLAAQNELKEINGLLFTLVSVSPDKDLRLASEAKNILASGEAASRMGSDLSLAMDSLFNHGSSTMPEALDNFSRYGRLAISDSRELAARLNKINIDNLPQDYQAQFASAKEKSEFLEKGLSEFIDLTDKAKDFLGASGNKRYLLVFQNNAEMRGSGGFVGSFALVDFKDGKIKNIEAPGGGSYDTTAGLREKILPPEPFYLLGTSWYFWNANWWPDWPKSARKLAWFFEKSDGPTVDGVIGITPTAVEEILKAIGPLDMKEKYGIEITADNFWSVTQEIVEEKKTGAKEPKQIIGDLMTKLIDELPLRLNKDSFVGLIKAAEESLAAKHILFYFNDKKLQKKADELGWSGRMKETARDYLMVANTNIAGGKTDRKVRETISHEAEVMPNGSVIDTVKITREHTGGKGEPYVGVRNVDWMRIYIPQGSQLLEAQGFKKPDDIFFKQPEEGWNKDPEVAAEEGAKRIDKASGTEIYEEGNYTVFANWSMVDPGETAVIYLKYKLPFKLEPPEETFFGKIGNLILGEKEKIVSYSLLAQKQPGSFGSAINSILRMPEGFKIIWRYPQKVGNINGWQINDKLNTDKYWAAIINL